jgi:hypothetical protein
MAQQSTLRVNATMEEFPEAVFSTRTMELAQDRVHWRALVLAVLNLRVLLPES